MGWLSEILKFFGIGRSDTAGWDRLTGRQNEWIDKIEERLDECDKDRRELHKRADDCDEDRADLRTRLDKLEQRTNA